MGMWKVGVTPSNLNDQVSILFSFDINGTLQSYTASRWQDTQSIMSTWEIKPNRPVNRHSAAGSPSIPAEAPATAAAVVPAWSAKPLQQQLC